MNIERTSNMFTANDSMETTKHSKHCLEFMEFSDSNFPRTYNDVFCDVD